MIEQIGHKDHAHRGVVAAHQAFPNRPELGSFRKISWSVDAIGGHSTNVAWRPAGQCQHSENILERLLELRA
jgi:hypothetical protein